MASGIQSIPQTPLTVRRQRGQQFTQGFELTPERGRQPGLHAIQRQQEYVEIPGFAGGLRQAGEPLAQPLRRRSGEHALGLSEDGSGAAHRHAVVMQKFRVGRRNDTRFVKPHRLQQREQNRSDRAIGPLSRFGDHGKAKRRLRPVGTQQADGFRIARFRRDSHASPTPTSRHKIPKRPVMVSRDDSQTRLEWPLQFAIPGGQRLDRERQHLGAATALQTPSLAFPPQFELRQQGPDIDQFGQRNGKERSQVPPEEWIDPRPLSLPSLPCVVLKDADTARGPLLDGQQPSRAQQPVIEGVEYPPAEAQTLRHNKLAGVPRLVQLGRRVEGLVQPEFHDLRFMHAVSPHPVMAEYP